jgi:hypothetical protein
MPNRAATDEEVAARALVMIGASPLTSFGDTTTEAVAVATIYEDIVTQCMTTTRWRFAAAQVRLNLLVVPKNSRWEAAYQLPTDTLSLIAATIPGRDIPIEFDRYEQTLVTKEPYDELYLDYLRRVPTDDWPPYFTLPVIHLLASELAIAVAQNEQLSKLHYEKYMVLEARGRTMDSQGRTNSTLDVKRYERARR